MAKQTLEDIKQNQRLLRRLMGVVRMSDRGSLENTLFWALNGFKSPPAEDVDGYDPSTATNAAANAAPAPAPVAKLVGLAALIVISLGSAIWQLAGEDIKAGLGLTQPITPEEAIQRQKEIFAQTVAKVQEATPPPTPAPASADPAAVGE
jgi:hypothetical protein